MEETFIFDNSHITTDFCNKINNEWIIKEMIFEFDEEFKLSDFMSIDIHNKSNNLIYAINIFKNNIECNNNILIIKTDPFIDIENKLLHNNILYEIKVCNHIEWNKTDGYIYKYTLFKKCTIKIQKINFYITNDYTNYNNYKFILASNYFNNIDEFKKFIMEWTDCNEQMYNEWLKIKSMVCDKIIIKENNNKNNNIILIEKQY